MDVLARIEEKARKAARARIEGDEARAQHHERRLSRLRRLADDKREARRIWKRAYKAEHDKIDHLNGS